MRRYWSVLEEREMRLAVWWVEMNDMRAEGGLVGEWWGGGGRDG